MSTYVICLDSPLSGFPKVFFFQKIGGLKIFQDLPSPKDGPLSPRSPIFPRTLNRSKKIDRSAVQSFNSEQCLFKLQKYQSPQPGRRLKIVSASGITNKHGNDSSEVMKNCGVLPWSPVYPLEASLSLDWTDTVMSTNSFSGMHAYIQYIHTNRLHLCISNRIQYNTLH